LMYVGMTATCIFLNSNSQRLLLAFFHFSSSFFL
jgi:hypothetical protein